MGSAMTNPGPTAPSGSARRRLMPGVLALAARGVVYFVFFRGPGAPAPPEPDLSGVDPAVRKAIEGARAEVKRAPQSAEAWGRLGMVLSSHIFAGEALACFAEAERLQPRDPR